MEDRDEVTGPSDAEQAFEGLRAEVAAMRQAVESLPAALKKDQPGDTTATLGFIVKGLEAVGDNLAKLEQHPELQLTPAAHQRALAVAGGEMMRDVVRKLDGAVTAAENERRELAGLIGSIRGRRKQWEWLAWTGGAALLLGLLISPAIARLLPFGWNGHIAAFIMQADRRRAGGALMEAASPNAWRDLEFAAALLTPNKAALTACRDSAAKAKKEQHCSIVVPAP